MTNSFRPGHQALAACLLSVCFGITEAQTPIGFYLGSDPNGQLGRVVQTIPDLDADGVAEIVSGSPLRSTGLGFGTGRVEIRSGRTGTSLLNLDGLQAGERFGSAISSADVTGDGRHELAVGAPLTNGANGAVSGVVRIYALPGGTLLQTLPGLAAGDRFGTSIAALKDIDLDGRPDWVIGAPFADPSGALNAGLAVLCSGASGAVITTFGGEAAGDQLGSSVASAGDLDQDFRDDFVVSAPFFNGLAGLDSGRVYAVSSTGLLLGLTSGAASAARLGTTVLGLGDLDGDGDREIGIASEFEATPAGLSAGRFRCFSGPTFASQWEILGTEANALFGSSASLLGDMNGDGRSEVAIGARLDDGLAGSDAGRVAVVDGALGTTLFSLEGQTAGIQFGFSCALGRDFDLDGRPDLVASAPFANTSASQAGAIAVAKLNLLPEFSVRGYAVGHTPIAVAVTDLDGDADQDLAVLCAEDLTVHVLWNGNHATLPSTIGPGTFDTLPRTVIALDGSSPPTAIVAGHLDADANGELLIGRMDGSIERIDGVGTVTSPAFQSVPGLIFVDPSPTSGSVSGIAILVSGVAARVAVALSGTLVTAGSVRLVDAPIGSPTIGALVLVAPAIHAVTAEDVDISGQQDLIITSSSGGLGGGIHVLLAPNFLPATGSPTSVIGIPVRSTAGALDPDLLSDDVLVAATSLGAGGPRVLHDFRAGSGFQALVTPPGFTSARVLTAWHSTPSAFGAVLIDGLGRAHHLTGFSGGSFQGSNPLPIGANIVDAVTSQLTAFDGTPACNGSELVVVARDENTVRVVRELQPAIVFEVPLTGCPAGASGPVMSTVGNAVLGDPSFGLTLTNATPNVLAYLAIQVSPAAGTFPPVLPLGPCGLLYFGGDILLLPTATNSFGNLTFPIPVPQDPNLLCIDFGVLWAIVDGGFIPGGLTLSNALLVRFGERP